MVKMKKSDNFGYYIDNLIDLDWNHETDEPGQFYDDISDVDMLLADGNYNDAYDKLSDMFNRCTNGDMGYLIGELAGKIEAKIREPIEFHKKAVLEYIISCNSCCYGEIYEYCRDIGMDDKDTDEAINELESEGKIEFVNQMDWVAKTKKMKKSSLKSYIKNLRNCLLDLATYFYNLNPGSKTDGVSNEITQISDELYYIMDDLSIDKGKVILVDGEIYEIPDSMEDKIKLAKEICYSIENELNIGDYDDIRERLNESLNKIKYLLHLLEDTESKSTKKSIPSIHDMIAQTRANNNSLTKSRVDLIR